MRYALLLLPSANRVYGRDAPRLARAELQIVLGDRVDAAEEADIAGVPYIAFGADDLDGAGIASLSTAYALFERHGDALTPVPLPHLARLDDDLLTIQRYQGKTNEQFTKLLLNVTLACTSVTPDRLRILDPVAGRGTTLNHALVAGCDAAGIEHERQAFDAYAGFLTTWLRDKRMKHDVHKEPVRRNGKVVARRLDVTFAHSKTAQREGDVQSVRFVQDDTRNALDHFKPASMSAVVGDLPYGVQHASRGGNRTSRSPADLVAEALPVWARLLRPGGGLGLAFNEKVVPREQLAETAELAGLRVHTGQPFEAFRHRVDHAILRDVLVASKTRPSS